MVIHNGSHCIVIIWNICLNKCCIGGHPLSTSDSTCATWILQYDDSEIGDFKYAAHFDKQFSPVKKFGSSTGFRKINFFFKIVRRQSQQKKKNGEWRRKKRLTIKIESFKHDLYPINLKIIKCLRITLSLKIGSMKPLGKKQKERGKSLALGSIYTAKVKICFTKEK